MPVVLLEFGEFVAAMKLPYPALAVQSLLIKADL